MLSTVNLEQKDCLINTTICHTVNVQKDYDKFTWKQVYLFKLQRPSSLAEKRNQTCME